MYNMPEWPGWEEKSTAEGKLFFVDHSSRKTHWKHPAEQGLQPAPVHVANQSSDAARNESEAELVAHVEEVIEPERAAEADTGADAVQAEAPPTPEVAGVAEPEVVTESAEPAHEEDSVESAPTDAALNDTQVSPEPTQEVSAAALASLGKSVGDTLDELLGDDTAGEAAVVPDKEVYNMPEWPGWEEKSTPEGKLFFVDHSTRQTHWKHPAEQPKAAPKKSIWKSLLKTGLSTASTVIREKLDENEALVTSVLDT